MKRFPLYFLLLIAFVLFSSCIRDSLPEETTQHLLLGETLTFQVTADNSVEWYLDDVQVTTGSEYTFTADETGTFDLEARETPFTTISKVAWTINVTGTTYYRDNDGDEYGDAGDSVIAGEQPEGYVEDNTDCDDNNSDVNPGAAEICGNDIDDDCDGFIDGDDADSGCSTILTSPQNVDASDLTDTFVTISWDAVAGAEYYKVYRAATSSGDYALVSPDDESLTGTSWDYVESWSDITDALGDYPVQDADESDEAFQTELAEFNTLAREVLTDYKDVGYFVVKAFNASAESSFSEYNAGRAMLAHSDPDAGGMSEFFEIYKVFWMYPLYQAFTNIPSGWDILNWSWSMEDYAGDGDFSAETGVNYFSGTVSISLSWNEYAEGRINDDAGRSDRIMTIDGVIYKEVDYSTVYNGDVIAIDETFAMTDDYPGTVALTAEIDLAADTDNTTGTAAVTYNGVTYDFPIILNINISLDF